MSEPRGFTLLELLVAITLLGLVVGSAVASFQAGVIGYRRGTAVAETTQRVRGGLALLAVDIEGAVAGREGAFAADRLEVTLATGGAHPQLRRVIYRIREGQLQRQLLEPGERESAVSPVVVLDRLVETRFEFLTAGVWVEEAATWPRAVRLRGHVREGARLSPVRTGIVLPLLQTDDAAAADGDGDPGDSGALP